MIFFAKYSEYNLFNFFYYATNLLINLFWNDLISRIISFSTIGTKLPLVYQVVGQNPRFFSKNDYSALPAYRDTLLRDTFPEIWFHPTQMPPSYRDTPSHWDTLAKSPRCPGKRECTVFTLHLNLPKGLPLEAMSKKYCQRNFFQDSP